MPEPSAKPFELSLQRDARSDPLSDALEYLNLRGWIPGRFELTSPWGIRVDGPLGWFYLVLQNQCLVEVNGQTIPVPAGDLIIISQGLSHCLWDKGGGQAIPIEELLEPRHFEQREPLVFGGGGPATQVACGCLLLDGLERSPLRSALPAFIHVRGRRQQPLPYVDHLVCLLDLEA
ncbi:MAG TPA: cupin domain-containing protein [Phycisphaerae bacterium]|nr:cupin domain-containing protein [Phycisphaerae bacterium]